ncbi:MAG: glucose dehydrogenase [Micrococcales bacterium]|nr:MAG: glucose dehydrogenase [Micrococcales bacterium]PIE27770.1 MAG: glucose dehydrogenase [Micrococcales bacterium]
MLAASGCADAEEDIGEVPAQMPSQASTIGPQGTAAMDVPERGVAPAVRVEEVSSDLEHGWDLGFLPDGQILVTERPARLSLLSGSGENASRRTVEADLDDVMVQGEGGLMGMVIHPDFEQTRRFTTCQTHQQDGKPVDIRLVTWELAEDGSAATKVTDLLTGLPLASSGRHSGCRPELAQDGALIVGTGDTANGSLPQDLSSLGGKVLRLNLRTGEPLPDNPFAKAQNTDQRFVLTYGHRNVQGVAPRPGTNRIFSVEHGPDINDEVNLLTPGANYGWDPAQGGTVTGYDEDVPMTDTARYPDAVNAVWRSGQTTLATCDGTFVTGEAWGQYDGALAVTTLKASRLMLMRLSKEGEVESVSVPEELDGTYGRLRAAVSGPDGSLYLTTTNGDRDSLLRVTPSS